MMETAFSYFAIGLTALILGIVFARQRKETLADQWHRAFALAQELVPAVEQLFLTGQIAKHQRLDAVMRELRAHFPALDEVHLRWAAENAVNLMNQGKLVPIVTEGIEEATGWLQGVKQ